MNCKFLAIPFLLGTAAFTGPAFAQHGRPDHPSLPDAAQERSKHGEEAVQALGDRLPEVAQQHRMSAERLTQLLRADHDLRVDNASLRLFYADSHLPDPAQAAQAPVADAGAAVEGTIVPLDQTFRLHSRPNATRKIYLDFNGYTTTNTWWNTTFGIPSIVTPTYDIDGNPSSFSTTELTRIQNIWQRVSEDYAPFEVDVTTEDPGVNGLRRTSSTDVNYGTRVAIGGNSEWYGSAVGGVGGVGAFDDYNSDAPCFAFAKNLLNGDEQDTAEAISHEVGHTLGLNHDGTSTTGYYTGQGTGVNGWAPIMGVGYYKSLVQFSKGEYADANNKEDDLAVISGYVPYRTDDHGNTFATASSLPSGQFSVDGIIERNTDVDMFKFTAGAGNLVINIGVDSLSADLNAKATLYNGSGAVVALSDPAGYLTASFNLTSMPAGTYYLAVEGTGYGDPLTTGYSKYGSLGHYTVSGTVPVSGYPTAVAAANVTSGYAPLNVQFSSTGSKDPEGGALSYLWDFGNGTTSTEANPSVIYPNPGSYTAVLTVTDPENLKSSAKVNVTVQETPAVPSAPAQLTAAAFSKSQINLKWTDTAANETGFYLERSINGGSWSRIATLGVNSTGYADTGLSANTTYAYRVQAFNAAGTSAYSNGATIKTATGKTNGKGKR